MKKNTLKSKFRDGLSKFYQEHFNLPEKQLNPLQQTYGLGLFYLRDVYSRYHPGLLPEEISDYEHYSTDGSNDQGIDFIYSQDSHHYICQFKYRGKRKPENESDVLHFSTVFERIHPQIGKDHTKNQKLLDLLTQIDFQKDNFTMLYITLGSSSDDIKTLERKGVANIQSHSDLKDLENRVEFLILDDEQLNIEYRDTRNASELVNVDVKLSRSYEGSPWYKLVSDTGKKSYISSIEASQVHQLYLKGNRSSLFNLNIRNYIGDTRTNKRIIESALTEANDFFFYNNGISAICSKVEESENDSTLKCRHFSIINGAQTFRSISKAYTKLEGESKKQIQDLNVMIRITEIPNLFKDNNFIDSVTRYNNTQNAVKISDFRSNDGVQNSLSNRFKEISFLGKKYHYKNKRDKDNPKNSIVISLDDFCRTVHSFKKGPIDFFGGLQYLYETNNEGGYYYLFADLQENAIKEEMDDETFRYYSSIWFLSETARDFFKDIKAERIKREEEDLESNAGETSTELVSKRALDGKYLIIYMLGIIIEEVARKKEMDTQQFLSKYKFHDPGKWRENKKVQNFLKEVIEFACDELVREYEYSSRDRHFVYRNWFRQKTTLRNLKKAVANSGKSNIARIADNLIVD